MTTATAQANLNLASSNRQQVNSIELTARLVLAAKLSLADMLFSKANQLKQRLLDMLDPTSLFEYFTITQMHTCMKDFQTNKGEFVHMHAASAQLIQLMQRVSWQINEYL